MRPSGVARCNVSQSGELTKNACNNARLDASCARAFLGLLLQSLVQQTQPGLAVQQRLGEPLAFVDVLDDAERVKDVAVRVADRSDIDAHPQRIAGLAQEAFLDLDLRCRTIDQGPPKRGAVLAVIRMHDVEEAAPDQLVLGITEHGTQRRIDGAETEVEPGHRLAERALFEHAAKPLFAVAQCRLGQLAAGDVDIDAAVAHRRAGGVADHASATDDPA